MKKIFNLFFKQKRYINYLIGLFIFSMGILPCLLTIFYALPVADDFSYANDIAKLGGHNIRGVFDLVKSTYQTWQGVYYGVVLGGGIDPMRRAGFSGINIVLFLVMILNVCVMFGFIYQLYSIFYSNKKFPMIVSISAVLAGCLNVRVVKELYFWYVGACGYTIPLLTGILGITCMIIVLKNANNGKKEKLCLYFAIIFGFLSSGGALQVTAYICWIYMLLLSWSILKKKKVKVMAFAFCSTLLGALINVAAPGNYARQSISYEKISIFKAAYYAFNVTISEIRYIFSQTYIPWLLLLLIILAFLFLKPVKDKLYHPLIVGGAALISWLISTFPVCYGYADSTLASRGYETLDIYIIIGLFLFINSLVNWLKLKEIFLSKEVVLAMSILAMINIGYLQNSVPISSIPGMQCWQQIFSGELKRYHDEWIEVFDTIERSEDAVVEVPISRWAYEADLVIMKPGMSENFEKWVNDGIATYYGKEKVRVVVQDEIENDE